MQERKRLEGAKFVLLDCNHREIMCVKTDCKGEACIDKLPLGKYFLVEIEAPCGYRKCDKEIEINITQCNPDRCIEVLNAPCLGSLKIIKCSNE